MKAYQCVVYMCVHGCVCVCVCVCVFDCMFIVPLEEGTESPKAGDTGTCGLPNVGAKTNPELRTSGRAANPLNC